MITFAWNQKCFARLRTSLYGNIWIGAFRLDILVQGVDQVRQEMKKNRLDTRVAFTYWIYLWEQVEVEVLLSCSVVSHSLGTP